ncbi:peptidylprolyl isomerase [Solihabitans fulvus]|uniref:Peptidylprolyl isomerase n=1 Tax=Solihabitans fulvus TaxID=1892852 RepID=A0A5B2XF35_9PSEU|nr:peptidylprolyl isomerase [Solihabitans fulvus]KAA2261923.1 peptidylprolyl isomerase [Solihabitans fulvus]
MPSNEQRRQAAKRKLERQLTRRAVRQKRRRQITVLATVVGTLVVVGGVYLLATQTGSSTDASASTSNSAAADQTDKPASIPTEIAAAPKRPTPLASTVACDYPATPQEPAAKPVQAPPKDNISAQGTVQATLGTSVGDLKLTLDRALAPCTVNNFVSLAKQGYFNDTTCHRMTTGQGLQVLQCGDPTAKGSGGPGYSFADEVFPELKYGRGTLAMANAGKGQNNAGTNGSQFFIVYGDGSGLTPNYTVFGSIDADSLKLVDKVANNGVVRGTNPQDGSPTPGDGKPKTPVDIKTATIAN